MSKFVVSIVRYEGTSDSVTRAVDLCHGLDQMPAKAKVFIKPNIVTWNKAAVFPKWGVMTTSRVVEDVVALLKQRGVDDITIGEGIVTHDRRDTDTPDHAFETLGYHNLKKRYGVKVINIFERPFRNVDLGAGVVLNYNADILDSDFVVNLPVIKTHAQTVVSLGIKNLKGMIDIKSRKVCHGDHPVKDLHYMVARLANKLPPSLTLLDGIYTMERGPLADGKARRSDLLVASSDVLSADLVGAKVLGYEPSAVPHLVHAGQDRGRSLDLSDVQVVGETIDAVASFHEWTFPYLEDKSLSLPMAKMGIKGISYYKYDLTMCTYCSALNGAALIAIAKGWKGEPWDDVEVLTGKAMEPTPGKKKTILLGKCMYLKHKNNPNIKEIIPVKGCPPSPKELAKAFAQAGMELDYDILENPETMPGLLMKKYEGKPEFDESFFRIP